MAVNAVAGDDDAEAAALYVIPSLPRVSYSQGGE